MGWKGLSNGWLWLDGLDGCDLCCDELVICPVSLGIGRVPHPGSARKPQPSLLQVLFGMQKLLSDRQEIFFERICQRPTSITNNLIECLPKSKNVKVLHLPVLPFIEHVFCRCWSVGGCGRTRPCEVLCRLLIHQEKYIQEYLNECSCLSRLFAF